MAVIPQGEPTAELIDPSLPTGSWYVVRGLTQEERAELDKIFEENASAQ